MFRSAITIEQIFIECNSHLREYDKNRDQLIQFYLVVIGGYLAALNAAGLDKIVILFLGLGIFLLGIVLTRSVTDYRLWHSRYAQTAKLLAAFGQVMPTEYRQTEKIMRKLVYKDMNIVTDKAQLKKDTHDPISRIKFYYRWKLTGTEYRRFHASLIITTFPLFIILYYSLMIIFEHCAYLTIILENHPFLISFLIILFILLYGVIYYFESIYYGSFAIYKVSSECPWAYWLLDGLDPAWNFKDGELRRKKLKNHNK